MFLFLVAEIKDLAYHH